MPSGAKKRKAARKKQETDAHFDDQSPFKEKSSGNLESIDENTASSIVDDGLELSKKHSALALDLPTDDNISAVQQNDVLIASDHNETLDSNKENLVHDVNSVAVEEIPVLVSNGNVEAYKGLSSVDSVLVVQENVQTLLVQQNLLLDQKMEQIEGVKKTALEALYAAEKMTISLQKLRDELSKL